MEWSNGGQQWAGGQGVNGGSGMRAVFLGSAGSGRESGGTGVFLPRCIGGASDHRRKPGENQLDPRLTVPAKFSHFILIML